MQTNDTKEFVAEHRSVTTIGRLGWLAKGIVYVIAGLLAALVFAQYVDREPTGGLQGTGSKEGGSNEASPTGAIKEVAQHTFGGPVLIALAAGLIIYAVWRLVSAAMPGKREPKVIATRIGYVASAVMYATFAFTALRLVVQSPSGTNGNSTVSDLSGSVMRHTGGRFVIGLFGVILLGVAVYRIQKGWTKDVTDELSLAGMSQQRRTWVRRLGAVGEIGRGVAVALIGFFLIRAALTYEPDEATGLDGALRRALSNHWTTALVPVVAVGFVAYGTFCLATFTHRRFEQPT